MACIWKLPFGTHRDGDDYYRMTKEGIINEFSVGFVPIQKERNDKGGFDITEIKLYEVSAVTVAANEEAVVTDIKSETRDLTSLIHQVEDEDLAFKLEKEYLREKSQQTTTQPVSLETPDSAVETKSDEFDYEAFNKALLTPLK